MKGRWIRPGIPRLLRLPVGGRRRREREIEEELRLHLDLRAERLMREGLSPEEARAEAVRRLGGAAPDAPTRKPGAVSPGPRQLGTVGRALVHTARRRARRLTFRRWTADLAQDLRHGVRSLGRSPGFTVVAGVTLALGIGASTAMFSVVDGVLLRPLPYHDPGDLVALFATEMEGAEVRNPTSPGNFLDWKEQSRTLERMTAAHPWAPTLTGGEAPAKLAGLKATPDLFELLGVPPLLGRTFAGPPTGAAESVVVLGHGLWTRLFGGDPAVVGRTLTLDGAPYTVVGVMPPGFQFPPFWATRAELWTPLTFPPEEAARRGASFLRVFARLRPGSTVEEARVEMAALGRRLAATYPDNQGLGVATEALREPVVSAVRPALIVLSAAVGLLLLLACLNVANLLLGRAASRERELRVRAALGAGCGRLLRQGLTESLLLAALGAAGGAAVATLGIRGLVALGAGEVPRLEGVGPDAALFGFAVVVALGTSLLFGLGPALRAARRGPEGAPGLHGTGGGRGETAVRRTLAGVQVALAVVLLVGAGLLGRSFAELARIEPGFEPAGVFTVGMALGASSHAAPERQGAFYRSIVERARALPGVREAAVVNHLPISGDLWRSVFAAEDGPPVAAASLPRASMRVVSPGWFAAMGLPLLGGRTFEDRDGPDAPPVVIVNAALARRLWGAADPVGRSLLWGEPGTDAPVLTVVGVAGDARQQSLAEPPLPEVYFPFGQNPFPWFTDATLVVRHDGVWAGAAALQGEIWAVDRDVPVFAAAPMDRVLSGHLQSRRFQTVLLAFFAGTALILATVGLFGVISYLVGRRTREIGVRVALGAGRPDVRRLVLGEGTALVALGALAGVASARALSGSLEALLFGVGPGDPAVYAGAVALVAAVALLATWMPMRRAAGVDPVTALRSE